ncbi:unnamed protein product [Umbelopsis vinacea]
MIRTTRSSSNPSSPSLVPLMTTSIQDEEQDLSSLMPSQPSISWDSLRKQARQLENEAETKLASLTKAGSNLRRKGAAEFPGNSLTEITDLEYQTEEVLKRLQTIITLMSEYLDRPSATPSNPSMLHMLQRHKDIAFDYSKELRKVKASLRAARDKADLLTQVQDEIRQVSTQWVMLRTYNNGGSTSEYMLTERNKIENSHRMTDMVLDQAYATRDDLGRQRSMLRGVNSRMGGVLGRLPGINNLIGKINTRRKRDTVIMALEEEEPPEPPQCFSRTGDTDLVHEPLKPQEKPFSVNKHHKLQIVLPTPKAEVDNFCIDVKKDIHTHQSTYDELIVETDILVVQLKADSQSNIQVEPLEFLPGSAKFNSCFLRQEDGHKNTPSLAQVPRCPCPSPKDKAKSSKNHLASSQVLRAFHNNADPGRHEWENCSNADNCSYHWNHKRLLHSSSSSDLRRQRSHVQMDPDAIRYVCPRKQDSSTTSCSSNSSSSGKRPCLPRGPGVQLIEGKTIGEILHANPLIRKGDTSLALARWRS